MKSKRTRVKIAELRPNDANPRVITQESTESLAQGILSSGYVPALVVIKLPTGVLMIAQGHRRMKAALWIEENEPKRFDEIFPNGTIEAYVYEDTTPEEQANLLSDWSLPLQSDFEGYRAAKIRFAQGWTEKRIVTELRDVFESIAPTRGNALIELRELAAKRDAFRAAGDNRNAWKAQSELEDRRFKQRRGKIQTYGRIYKLPPVVEASLEWDATGSVPEGYKAEELVQTLNQEEIKKLHAALTEDLTEKDKDGNAKWAKSRPGPHFHGLWSELLKKRTEEPEKDTRQKAMPASKMMKEITEGAYNSVIAILVTKKHAGQEIDGAALLEADLRAHYADTVAQFDPEAWKRTVALARELIAAEQQALKEAAAK